MGYSDYYDSTVGPRVGGPGDGRRVVEDQFPPLHRRVIVLDGLPGVRVQVQFLPEVRLGVLVDGVLGLGLAGGAVVVVLEFLVGILVEMD